LLGRFAQDDRIQISKPKKDLQVKLVRSLGANNEFVSYIDALRELDGIPASLIGRLRRAVIRKSPKGCSRSILS
jgi:hypothetical protein